MSSVIDCPNVSVVVSTYNHAHVLPHALESLLKTRWQDSFFSSGSLRTTPAA
jgi:hypothetical protein